MAPPRLPRERGQPVGLALQRQGPALELLVVLEFELEEPDQLKADAGHPAIPTQEKSSLRNTFSMSRWAIMLPAVDRRSPAMSTPPAKSTATIVVPCGRSGTPAARKSAKDDVPALKHAAVNCPPR